MRMSMAVATGLALILLLPAFSLAEAQQSPPGGADAQADTVELIFEREVFEYPTFQRRNPFRPLTGDDAGPRFEEMALQGVILSSDGVGSVALLGPRGAAAGSRNWRVREGDVLGNMRVLAIRQREILVEVDEFGVRESRILELRRTEPEAQGEEDGLGSPPGAPGCGGGSQELAGSGRGRPGECAGAGHPTAGHPGGGG